MKKRIIALTILLAFLGLALQAQVSAPWTGGIATGFSGGSGTEDDPWLITTGDELAFLAQQVFNRLDDYEKGTSMVTKNESSTFTATRQTNPMWAFSEASVPRARSGT